MGKASVPKRGRAVKTRPLRSDAQTKGMPSIALGKGPKKGKLKPVTVKKGKVKLKPTKAKQKAKPEAKPVVDAEDSDTASVVSARVRRSVAPDTEASTSKPPNEADVKGSKRLKPLKGLSERSESPATTRLSRSSSANSFVGKTSEAKKTGKAAVEKGKGKSPVSTPTNKTILNYFTRKGSPSSKGPTESNTKKTISSSKKELEVTGSSNKRGTPPTDSSPDSVNSGSNRSNQVTSERSEINDDDLSALDDAESCLDPHSEDLDAPSTLNGAGGRITKAVPKLTRKNINELFPSDESANRLRSGSPASQKSTRSLTLQKNSPKSASASSLRSTTMSDSAVRFLRNGQQNKLKRASLFETASKKKKRVYAGALKDEDKVEDSRSDFSDEQSSIFSESDSSSFIDTSSRLKNADLDKMDVEDVPGSMSNDEDDGILGGAGSPTQKNLSTTTNAMVVQEVKENPDASESPPADKDSEKGAQQPPKNIEILNNIQSDWDSDGEANSQENDTSEPNSPKEGHSAFDELLTSNALPQLNEKLSGTENVDTKDVIPPEVKKLEEKQDADAGSETLMDSSKSETRPNAEPDKPFTDQTESSKKRSKLPGHIVLKTTENKNSFVDSVEFVAKRNSKIDFELLRRRTKRSMSFNTDTQEISQNQKILTVESNNVHGKPALVWTVTAVRDPIIPKSTKSSEKKLTKSDSQERNISPVKPMMESTQNDLTTAIPKVSPDAILTPSQFTVSSSSVKENIMVPTSPKQSPGKSPVRESVVSCGSPKSVPISSTKEAKSDSSVNGGLDADKSSSAISKQCSEPTSCSLEDGSTKQPSESSTSSAVEDIIGTLKLSPSAVVLTSNDAFSGETHVATALKTPIKEISVENDPAVPSLATEKAQTSEPVQERSSTPDSSLSALQKDVEITPDKGTFDDESFSLRLSPTPTKEENCQIMTATVSSSKIDSPLKSIDLSPAKLEIDSAGKENESNSHDLATRLLDDGYQPEEILDQNYSNADIPGESGSQSLQLVIKKGSCRPRSLSADCNPSAVSFVDDVWIVKNGESCSSLETTGGEDRISSRDEKNGDKESKDDLAGKCQDLHLEIIPNSVTHGESSEADNSSVKADAIKNDKSSDVIAETVKQPGLLSPRLEAEVERHNLELNDIEKKRREITEEEQSPEKKAIKEWILNSLGLQSVTAAAAAAASGAGRPTKRRSQDGLLPSSGRLKAVIKVPKDSKRDKKSDRKPLRMVFKNGKPHLGSSEDGPALGRNLESDPQLEGNNGLEVSGLLFNGPDYPANGSLASLGDAPSSLPTAEGDGKGKPGANLVIPEKSSSFSIHPGRLCSDVCSYCFGKFGSLDTPCHVAQLKSRERQMKIMSVETHLALDSCLCDACIRYVDRKANCPSSKPQTTHRKDSKSKFEGSMATCSVTSCVQPARHSLRKKWYIKIRKSVVKKCPIDLELAHQHLPLPLCPEHFSYLEYFMVCGLCKRRLSRNHMYNLNNTHEINICLEHDGIPARLSDKLFVCKLCRYYATLRVKHPGSHFNLSSNQREFFNSYRKRILLSHDIEVSDSEGDHEAEAEEPVSEDASQVSGAASSTSNTSATTAEENLPKGKRKRSGSNAVAPVEADSGEQPKKKSRHGDQPGRTRDRVEPSRTASRALSREREREPVPPVTISVSEINQATHSRSHKGGRAAKKQQEAGDAAATEMVRKGYPPFYPGEDELALHAKFQFQFDDEPSANRAWEKCTSTLQFDKDTKRLWQELQRPYGSQSSFLRHLVLMERYWREGELVLAPDASAKATSYTRSVQNRLKAYGATITVKSAPEPACAASASASTSTSGQAALKAVVPAPALASPAQPVAPSVAPAKPDVSLSLLTGDTVLTAAAAAAAVTAVHTAPLPSPSGEASPNAQPKQQQPKVPQAKVQQARAQQAKVPQLKLVQCQIPQRKTQPVKGVQNKPKTAGAKSQAQANQVAAMPKPQQSVPVAPVATPLALKSPQAITVTVKPPEPTSVKQPPPRNQVAISLASHPHKSISPSVSVSASHLLKPITPSVSVTASTSHPHRPISTSMSVPSGVTITPEITTGKTTLEKQQAAAGKLHSILPKPLSTSSALKSSSPSNSVSVSARVNTSSWETSSSSPPSRQQFIPLSSSPVVNLTRSISLTAVPSTPSSVPDLHPINPQTPRPNRSPATTLPLSINSVSVSSSRGPSGAYVSIIPTSPSKAAYTSPSSLSVNKTASASITPIYTSQPLPAPMNVTSTTTSSCSVSSPAVASTESRAPNTGKVQVAAGGKFFYLTIPQFKKLQTLRQQRQQEQQKKQKAQAAKQDKEKRNNSSKSTSTVQKNDLEVVEVRDTDCEAQLTPLPTISAVCSGDQAKAMWDDESRISECDPSVSISVAPPVVEITPIIAKADIPVENMPKIPKTLTVTQIRKESPPLSKTVSASGISLTITRQKCQTPVAPQMSSPALDIFPS